MEIETANPLKWRHHYNLGRQHMNKNLTINNMEDTLNHFQETVFQYQDSLLLTSEVCTALIEEGTRLRKQLTSKHQSELEAAIAFLKDFREELASLPAA